MCCMVGEVDLRQIHTLLLLLTIKMIFLHLHSARDLVPFQTAKGFLHLQGFCYLSLPSATGVTHM